MPSADNCEECECGSVVDPDSELLTPVCTKKQCNSTCNEVMQGTRAWHKTNEGE